MTGHQSLVTVLVTCAGGPMAVEMIRALARTRAVPVRVVGVDVDEYGAGRQEAAAFYAVPPGDDPAYAERLLAICRREGVRVVIPGSDEEALALSRAADHFRAQGTVCMAPRPELAPLFADKSAMYGWLAARGVPIPAHIAVHSAGQLREAARALGYPERSFVVKPVSSRGGRGVWLIRAQTRSFEELMARSPWRMLSLDELLAAIEQADRLPSLLAMPYFSGAAFDVDVLAKAGAVCYAVPRRRINPMGIPFHGCVLERHDGVLALVHRIAETLAWESLYDVDIALGDHGQPQLLEVNPRLSGSVIATVAAGLNVLEDLVCVSLGLPMAVREIPYGVTVRSSARTVCLKEGEPGRLSGRSHVSGRFTASSV